MDSILKPLAKKVDVFTSHIGVIMRGLASGDPEAMKQVESLWKDLSNFYQECQAGYAAVYASYNNSVSTAQSAYNPSPMIKMIAYYIGEAMAAIQLISNLIKLITSILSIATLLQFLMVDLLEVQKALNTSMLWMRKAIDRAKQKLSKQIEWAKRQIAAKLNTVYLEGQLKAYQQMLDQLNASLPKPPTPKTGIGGNGTYVDGTFVYFDKAATATLNNDKLFAASNASSLSNLTPAGLSSASSGASNSIFNSAPNLTLPSSSTSSPISSTTNNIVNSPTSSNAVNTTISNANTSQVSGVVDTNTTEDQITAVKSKISSINLELKAADNEIKINIPEDKKYWNNLWDKQAEQDKKDLLTNLAIIGVNV